MGSTRSAICSGYASPGLSSTVASSAVTTTQRIGRVVGACVALGRHRRLAAGLCEDRDGGGDFAAWVVVSPETCSDARVADMPGGPMAEPVLPAASFGF
jgi:hypothetical protein